MTAIALSITEDAEDKGDSMRTTMVVALSGCLGLTAGGVMLAAPSQDRPGIPTKAQVWIENRGPSEAIPVSVPGGVQVTGTANVAIAGIPTVALASTTMVQTRAARQAWEYRMLRVPNGGDMGALLSTAGLDGWEVTGLQTTEPTATLVVMKRPRS
jgi:hypothetical protein